MEVPDSVGSDQTVFLTRKNYVVVFFSPCFFFIERLSIRLGMENVRLWGVLKLCSCSRVHDFESKLWTIFGCGFL